MLDCWPLPCFRQGHRRGAPGCFAFLSRPCARWCFNARAVFARHAGRRRLSRDEQAHGRRSKTAQFAESDTRGDGRRQFASTTSVGEDGVRPAMASVYIDSDVLLPPNLLSRRRQSDDTKPLSVVTGAEGLPNTPLPFFQARDEAAQERVWLIVNLQHADNRNCETLNCDIWGQPEFCQDIFANKAKLWQRDVGHIQAEQFIAYYFSGQVPSAEQCPVVIIIDPRTGRALRRWKAGSEDSPLGPEKVQWINGEWPTRPACHIKALQLMTNFFVSHTLEGFSPPESPQCSPKTSPEMKPALEDDPSKACLEEFDLAELALDEDETEHINCSQSCALDPFWDSVEATSSVA